MKKKRKPTARKTRGKGRQHRIGTLRASAEDLRDPSADIGTLYKPIKKPVTLRLDADVLAWFRTQGKGYQTRINAALRRVMKHEKKAGTE